MEKEKEKENINVKIKDIITNKNIVIIKKRLKIAELREISRIARLNVKKAVRDLRNLIEE